MAVTKPGGTKIFSAGQEWHKEIDEAIRDAFAMIVVITRAARNSEYVTYEWSSAIGMNKPVIPILYEETEIHPRLKIHQFLDFTDTRVRPWSILYTRLRNIAEGNISNEPSLMESNLGNNELIHRLKLVGILGEIYYSGLIDLRTLNMFLTQKMITKSDITLLRTAAANRNNHAGHSNHRRPL